MIIVSTPLGLKPGCTERRLRKLRTMSPAAVMSTSESATCDTTSARSHDLPTAGHGGATRAIAQQREIEQRCPEERQQAEHERHEQCTSSGERDSRRAEMHFVQTRQAGGRDGEQRAEPAARRARRRAPPHRSRSTTLSARSCTARCSDPRRARRAPPSRGGVHRGERERGSTRLAAAMNSTTSTAPKRIHSARVMTSPTTTSRSGRTWV